MNLLLLFGVFGFGLLIGLEWSAHWSADLNRTDAVAFHDHADDAIELFEPVVIP